MIAPALRQAVAEVGGALRNSHGQLVVKAPAGTLTPDLIASLREHKAELLALLEAEITETRRRAENAFSLDAMADEAELCIRGELA